MDLKTNASMQRLVGPLTVALLGLACLIGAIAFAVE